MSSKMYIRIFIILDIVFMVLLAYFIWVNAPTDASVKATVKAAIADQKATQIALESSLSNLEDENKEQSRKLSNALSQAAALKMRSLCAQYIPGVDYTDDETVATSLKGFIRQIFGEVIESNDWTPVFEDAHPSIHRLYSKNYMWAYVVYITESGRGPQGIFDLANACWVNIPDGK